MTQKQEALKSKILENSGKPMGTLMKEAGYSEETAKNPQQILKTDGIRNDKAFMEALSAQKWRAVAAMDDKIDKAGYSDLVRGIDTIHKLERLEDGKSTDNQKLVIEWGSEDPDVHS